MKLNTFVIVLFVLYDAYADYYCVWCI